MIFFSEMIIIAILAIALLIAVISDIRFRRIPNWLTYPAMAVAVGYHAGISGLTGFLFSIEGVAAGICLLIVPYLLGGMGAGDAKLMGAVGGFLGPKGVFIAFLFTALTGGLYAISVLTLHNLLKETLQRYVTMFKNFFLMRKLFYIPSSEKEKEVKLRYGVAIAVGTLLSVLMKDKLVEIANFI